MEPKEQRMPTDEEEDQAAEFFEARGSGPARMVSWDIAVRMAALYGLWSRRFGLEEGAKIADYHHENHCDNNDGEYRNCGMAIATGIRDLTKQ